jgi:hypothetical protein
LGSKLNKKIIWQFIVFEFNEHQIETARSICKQNNILFKLVKTYRTSKNIKLPSESYRPKGLIKEWTD